MQFLVAPDEMPFHGGSRWKTFKDFYNNKPSGGMVGNYAVLYKHWLAEDESMAVNSSHPSVLLKGKYKAVGESIQAKVRAHLSNVGRPQSLRDPNACLLQLTTPYACCER